MEEKKRSRRQNFKIHIFCQHFKYKGLDLCIDYILNNLNRCVCGSVLTDFKPFASS